MATADDLRVGEPGEGGAREAQVGTCRVGDETRVLAGQGQPEPGRVGAGVNHRPAPLCLGGQRGDGENTPGDRAGKAESVRQGHRFAEDTEGTDEGGVGYRFGRGSGAGRTRVQWDAENRQQRSGFRDGIRWSAEEDREGAVLGLGDAAQHGRVQQDDLLR